MLKKSELILDPDQSQRLITFTFDQGVLSFQIIFLQICQQLFEVTCGRADGQQWSHIYLLNFISRSNNTVENVLVFSLQLKKLL